MSKYQKKVNKHEDVCMELNKLYEKKNEDYDDSFAKSLETYGMAMPCIRLEDKLNRLRALTVKGTVQNVSDESVMDTLMDMANYAIMTIVELKLKEENNNGTKN